MEEHWEPGLEVGSMDDEKSQDGYTPEQRETLEAGLRILARMVVRAYMP